MKKNIMKKLAILAVKFAEMNLSHLLVKGKKAFKNNNLRALVVIRGRLEARRKTCFASLPRITTKVNNYRHLQQ